MRSLVWFRSDLRTHDNTALAHAARRGEVIGVVTLCPRQWRDHDWGDNKAHFILQSMAALADELHQLNIPLRVITAQRFNTVPEHLLKLARQTRCDALHFNAEYEINERRRDDRVGDRFDRAGLDVCTWQDQTILPPTVLQTRKQTPYTVYTPFKKAWIDQVSAEPVHTVPPPAAQQPLDVASDTLPTRLAGYRQPQIDLAEYWPPGSSHAQQRLDVFVRARLSEYHDQRDLPSVPGTSELSPYLACGAISPRQCLAAAQAANDGHLDDHRPGPTAWIGELIWREFYRHILFHFPRVSMHKPFDRTTDRIAWRDDDTAFQRWCDGQTGVPIVDAGMQQLRQIGWMHNRLRMVVATYLSKTLLIDWRRGERFFMQHLVDGDLANNNGGWQWAASTGTDAAPYFRIFNPIRQGQRFDADGHFVRRWCPALADAPLTARQIHDPQTWPDDLRRELNWPDQLVDLREARLRALAAYKKAREP